MPSCLSLAKKPSGFFASSLQSAARIICLPLADKFHTCSLSCVFVHVHAAVENDFHFIRRFRGELCEAFFDSLKQEGKCLPVSYSSLTNLGPV